jgi:hypothetical protein
MKTNDDPRAEQRIGAPVQPPSPETGTGEQADRVGGWNLSLTYQ